MFEKFEILEKIAGEIELVNDVLFNEWEKSKYVQSRGECLFVELRYDGLLCAITLHDILLFTTDDMEDYSDMCEFKRRLVKELNLLFELFGSKRLKEDNGYKIEG